MITTGTRLEGVLQLLEQQGVSLLLVSPSADLQYLTGHRGHASERPTLLALRVGREPLLLVPNLEAPGAADLGVRLVGYGETDNPYSLLKDALGTLAPASTIAISDAAWAAILLRLQEAIPGRYVAASLILREMRMRKSEDEVALLSRAGQMADRAFQKLVRRRFRGRTEIDIADELTALLRAEGLETGAWGPIVASGPNSASPHHGAGDRTVLEGDSVVLDFGGTLDGYGADITRTVHMGEPDEEFRRAYETVRRAQEAGVAAVRPGVQAQEIDNACRSVIDEGGYGPYFIHRTGHGIGLETHEEPYIVEGNDLRLEPGMTFSVEPGVYLPGRFGVRIEDIVAVEDDGPRRLNEAPRELTVVS